MGSQSWCYPPTSKEFKLRRGGGAGIQMQVGLPWFPAQLVLGEEIRASLPSSAKTCGLCLSSLFFPLHHSLGATQMAPLQFPEQSSIGRKLPRQPCQFPHFKGVGVGVGEWDKICCIESFFLLVCLACFEDDHLVFSWFHFACCPLKTWISVRPRARSRALWVWASCHVPPPPNPEFLMSPIPGLPDEHEMCFLIGAGFGRINHCLQSLCVFNPPFGVGMAWN